MLYEFQYVTHWIFDNGRGNILPFRNIVGHVRNVVHAAVILRIVSYTNIRALND